MFARIKKILFQIRLSFSKKGPYRFLIKKWHFFGDINLASKVIGTEFFRDSVEPVALPIEKFKRYVILAPHQDDETIGAGGLMALLADTQAKVSVVYVSNGSQYVDGQTIEQVVEIRNAEAKKALALVNADFYQLNIDDHRTDIKLEDIKELSALLDKLAPEIILLPWLLDGPAKHRLANHLLWLSDKIRSIKNVEIWGYQVHNTLYPNGYVDITEKIAVKKKMIECFASQNSYFQSYDHLSMGMAAWNSRFLPRLPGKIKNRYAELFFCLPSEEYFKLISEYYFKSFQETYKGRKMIMEGARAIHNEVLNYTKK